jgi:hypothetical protein
MIVLSHLYNLYNQNEKFANTEDENIYDGVKSMYLYLYGYNTRYYYRWRLMDYIILAVFYFAALLMSLASAYLSFTCTWKGSITNIPIRVLCAVTAFMLGPIYLIWYFFVNYLGKLC